MNSKYKLCIRLFILSLCVGCGKEQVDNNVPSELLAGRWNSYESGTEQAGFTPGITTSLTIGYESGMHFFDDGTFKLRRYDQNGLWTETDVAVGRYELIANTISLTYFSGTNDDLRLELQLVKLDRTYLWFRHSYFGTEIEHHLKRLE
jgi:hypothetical protein